MKRFATSASFLVGVAVFLVACNKQTYLDPAWTPPVKITESVDTLVGGPDVYKCLDAAIVFQPGEKGEVKQYFMLTRNTGSSNSWQELHFPHIPPKYFGIPTVDQASGRIIFIRDEDAGNGNRQTKVNAIIVRLTGEGDVHIEAERKWTMDKESLFGKTDPDVVLGNGINTGGGVMQNSDIIIPYCIRGGTYHRGLLSSKEGPFNNCVFHSTDDGVTWQMERISDFEGLDRPLVRRTKDYYYYFGAKGMNIGYGLWFSRKPVAGDSWEVPGEITKTYCSTYGYYAVATEADVAHVCWMDSRNDMKRFNVDGPNIENSDIIYRQRKDSDSNWSEDAILSKGLLYSYSPSISVEGSNVVVAWAAIRSAGKHHNEYDPNDIYYVTSKDGGKTWTDSLMVTDRAKEGIVSGKPHVVLLNGVIHLFYIQGALASSQQISPSLTKLSGGPWPICYTHRPFPN